MTASSGSARQPRVDVHIHLAGVGTQDSACWISPAFRKRMSFVAMRALFGISKRQMESTIDQDCAALVSALVGASDLDFGVALGFDGVYDDRGELDLARSQMIVPPSWVFEVCERYGNLLPAPSINPYRRDALEQLEEAIARGAVMIKWLPIVQAFDPASPRVLPFLRRMAAAGIPLLVHAGSGEVTFRTVDPRVGGLSRLVTALELGVPVICAHTAAPIHYRFERSELHLLRELLERFPHLWVDNSGLANPSRCFHLPRFARDPLIRERTLHGSDFPVVSSSIFYLHHLGLRCVGMIQAERNPLQREILLKRRLGVPESALTRPSAVLANLHRWCSTQLFLALAALVLATPGVAQLRPHEPLDWEIFDQQNDLVAHVGTGTLWGQRASLAGTQGRLFEFGTFQLFGRTGRVALEAAGTFRRVLHEAERFATPIGATETQAVGNRKDWGDYRVSTTVLLSPLDRPALAVLRFGTRLPTTDDQVGLERDQTDFFALVGGRIDRRPLRLFFEAGVGVHGTRDPDFEQSDVFVFVAGIAAPFAAIRPTLLLVGHADGLSGRAIRGNEELAELRLQVRSQGKLWLQLQALHGLTPFSPDFGLSLSLGVTH